MEGCPKRLLNGPCGGLRGDRCELGGRCAWYDAFAEGRLNDDVVLDPGFELKEVPCATMRAPPRFLRMLSEGRPCLVLDVHPLPGRIPGPDVLAAFDAISVPDNPFANPLLDPVVFSWLLKSKYGVEAIAHLACRDANRILLLSRLMTAGWLGVDAVLIITGDHPAMGPLKEAHPVFDLDSTRLIRMARLARDLGRDPKGRPLPATPRLAVGAGCNPNIDVRLELIRIRRKLKAGAEFFESQIVCDRRVLADFLRGLHGLGEGIPIIVGLMPLADARLARLLEERFGVRVDPKLRASAKTSDALEVSMRYILEMAEEALSVYETLGFYIASHPGYEVAAELARELRRLAG